AALLAGLDGDQAHVQACILVGGEAEGPRHVHRAQGLVGAEIINDLVACPDQHSRAGGRDLGPPPGGRGPPGTAAGAAAERGGRAGPAGRPFCAAVPRPIAETGAHRHLLQEARSPMMRPMTISIELSAWQPYPPLN